MKIYIGADHAGYELKEKLTDYLVDLNYEVSDKGAFDFNPSDDYPDFVRPVALSVAEEEGSMGIVIGASGQGEAMCANRIKGIRCALYYGKTGTQVDLSGNTLDMISSTRMHNEANMLALGARFLTEDEAKQIVKRFLETKFGGDGRHVRRIKKLDI
ncbi:MAG: RpiB/LacA/LacB family sugar-phosphate isomerase [Candidatus Paceibacterota bacterium]|jgi:ribose 5-phosphate isomerase B